MRWLQCFCMSLKLFKQSTEQWLHQCMIDISVFSCTCLDCIYTWKRVDMLRVCSTVLVSSGVFATCEWVNVGESAKNIFIPFPNEISVRKAVVRNDGSFWCDMSHRWNMFEQNTSQISSNPSFCLFVCLFHCLFSLPHFGNILCPKNTLVLKEQHCILYKQTVAWLLHVWTQAPGLT